MELKTFPTELKVEFMLQCNESLYAAGKISKALYEAAKKKIVNT